MIAQWLAFVALSVLFLGCQRLQRRIITREALRIMTKIEQLRADVEANKSVTESAIALLQGFKAQLDAAILADDSDKALQELSDSLEANTLKLAQAVTANTPASASTGEATSQTQTPSFEELPDNHPLKQ